MPWHGIAHHGGILLLAADAIYQTAGVLAQGESRTHAMKHGLLVLMCTKCVAATW